MAKKSMFSSSLFGFKKIQVIEFLKKLDAEIRDKDNEKKLEIDSLNKRISDLESTLAETERRKQVFSDANLELQNKLSNMTVERDAAIDVVATTLSDYSKLGTAHDETIALMNTLNDRIGQQSDFIIQLENEKTRREEDYAYVKEEKSKLAQAWITASEKADSIVREANAKAKSILDTAILESESERRQIENTVELEKEKLIDIKNDARNLKENLISILHRYSGELDAQLLKTDEDEKPVVNEAVVSISENEDNLDNWGIPELPEDFGKNLLPENEEVVREFDRGVSASLDYPMVDGDQEMMTLNDSFEDDFQNLVNFPENAKIFFNQYDSSDDLSAVNDVNDMTDMTDMTDVHVDEENLL